MSLFGFGKKDPVEVFENRIVALENKWIGEEFDCLKSVFELIKEMCDNGDYDDAFALFRVAMRKELVIG